MFSLRNMIYLILQSVFGVLFSDSFSSVHVKYALFKTNLFYKMFKPCRIVLEMKVIAVSYLLHCDHQYIFSINIVLVKLRAALSAVSKYQPNLLPSIPLLYWKYPLLGKKGNHSEEDICLYMNTHRKQISGYKRASLTCLPHREERQSLVLCSGPVEGKINSGTCLDEWSAKQVVSFISNLRSLCAPET